MVTKVVWKEESDEYAVERRWKLIHYEMKVPMNVVWNKPSLYENAVEYGMKWWYGWIENEMMMLMNMVGNGDANEYGMNSWFRSIWHEMMMLMSMIWNDDTDEYRVLSEDVNE